MFLLPSIYHYTAICNLCQICHLYLWKAANRKNLESLDRFSTKGTQWAHFENQLYIWNKILFYFRAIYMNRDTYLQAYLFWSKIL